MEWCLNGFKNIFVFRAEEVFETTDEGQQYTAEVACGMVADRKKLFERQLPDTMIKNRK